MTGVVIIALKKAAYFMGAHNLAFSIKYHNPSINITLLSDGEHTKHYGQNHYAIFDRIDLIPEDHYTDSDQSFQPGKCKLLFYNLSPYQNTLYLDADSLCFKDIGPLLSDLESKKGFFYSNVLGSGKKEDDIHYSVWATNQQLWDYFSIPEGVTLHNVNSSWIYVKKCPDADLFFARLIENYGREFGMNNLLHQWGGSYPDELFYNGTLAKMGIDPSYSENVMFFGSQLDPRKLEEIQSHYYFFTLYGKGTGVTTVRGRYIDFYERLMQSMCRAKRIEHRFKVGTIMHGKHLSK